MVSGGPTATEKTSVKIPSETTTVVDVADIERETLYWVPGSS